MKNYLIDIDGTVTADIPNEHWKLMITAKPFPGAVERINTLYERGHRVTFFTSRWENQREITETWLKEHGFKFHGLLMNKPRGGNYVWVDNLEVTYLKYPRDIHWCPPAFSGIDRLWTKVIRFFNGIKTRYL